MKRFMHLIGYCILMAFYALGWVALVVYWAVQQCFISARVGWQSGKQRFGDSDQ